MLLLTVHSFYLDVLRVGNQLTSVGKVAVTEKIERTFVYPTNSQDKLSSFMLVGVDDYYNGHVWKLDVAETGVCSFQKIGKSLLKPYSLIQQSFSFYFGVNKNLAYPSLFGTLSKDNKVSLWHFANLDSNFATENPSDIFKEIVTFELTGTEQIDIFKFASFGKLAIGNYH